MSGIMFRDDKDVEHEQQSAKSSIFKPENNIEINVFRLSEYMMTSFFLLEVINQYFCRSGRTQQKNVFVTMPVLWVCHYSHFSYYVTA